MTTAVTCPQPGRPQCSYDDDDILRRIMASDADALERFSNAIQERRFALGIGKFNKSSIYLARVIDSGVVAYVGSTTRSLKARWAGHENFFKTNPFSKWTKYVMEHGGVQNFQIELIEEYPCRSFQELLEREKHFIHSLEPVCNVAMRAEEPRLVLEDSSDSTSVDSDKRKRAARKYFNPAASFRSGCPSYDRLQEISRKVSQKILDNNELKKSSELEVLTAYRHIFDNHIADSSTGLELRKTVFDRVMRDKQSRRVLVNTTLWKDRQRFEVLEELFGAQNPFKPSFEDVNRVLELIRQLTQGLGLHSPWDCETTFSSILLGEKLTILQPIVKELVGIMSLPKSTAKKTRLNIVTCLKNILKQFCGTILCDTRHKIRIQDEKGFKDVYTYTPTCQEQSVKYVLEVVSPATA